MSAGLSNEEIEDRYFLLGRMEILNTLNDLIHRREPVTVLFNGGKDFILTLLLDARSEALIFDLGGIERANKVLEKAASCVFVATPDGIRVQFSGVEPQRFTWGETEAFWIPLPDRIVRLQRRESYRNVVPVINAPSAALTGENGEAIGDWLLHDLSVGGFGASVIDTPKVKVGDVIPALSISLPTKKTIRCAGVVRHITATEKRTIQRFRVGVEFKNLPHVMEVEIQRYIIKIEYERRKLLGQQP